MKHNASNTNESATVSTVGAIHELPLQSNLPEGWESLKLRDITERITKGSTPTSYGYVYRSEGIRFIKAENIDENGHVTSTNDFIDEDANEFLKRSILKENDVLFSIAGTIGRVGIVRRVDLPANTNQALAIIRTVPSSIDTQYLYYYLKSDEVQKFVSKLTVGVGRANLSLTNVSEIEVPIAPLNEQKLIIAEIEKQFSRLDEAVAALKRIQANLKRYKASVLKAAVEGKLTEEWRKKNPKVEPTSELLKRILTERRKKWEVEHPGKKYKEPALPDTSNLPKLPEGWVWATYDQLGEWTGGGTPTKAKASYWANGTIPWISPKDMKTTKIYDTEDKITKTALNESSAKLIAANSLLFVVRSGILRRILPIAINKIDAAVNQDIKALTPNRGLFSEYLLLSSLALSENIRHSCQKDGTTVESIEVPALQIYPIPLPPAKEQEKIFNEVESRLSVTEEIEEIIDVNLKRAERLRPSIFKKAFSGKLV